MTHRLHVPFGPPDAVLNGYEQNYERLSKLNPSGAPATNGIREIIAGTGGENHSISRRLYPGTEASDGGHFGILEMTLHPAGYDWQFVADTGSVIDSGSDACLTYEPRSLPLHRCASRP